MSRKKAKPELQAERVEERREIWDDIAKPVKMRRDKDGNACIAAHDVFGISEDESHRITERLNVYTKQYESMLDIAEALELQNAGKVAATAFFYGQLVMRNQMNAKMRKMKQFFDDGDD